MKLTEQNFQNLVSYWTGRLKLPLPLFRRDNRMKWSATVIYCKDCNIYTITYNFDIIKNLCESEVAGLIFHELGHIKYKTYNLNDRVESEYLAERYSLKNLKKYYSDFYKVEVKAWRKKIKEKNWRKKYPKYAKAFDKIKEYK
jgi:hypothetical protein